MGVKIFYASLFPATLIIWSRGGSLKKVFKIQKNGKAKV